jgi:hypothetical protein
VAADTAGTVIVRLEPSVHLIDGVEVKALRRSARAVEVSVSQSASPTSYPAPERSLNLSARLEY